VKTQALLANGKYATIEVVETEELDTFETTYNFEVEDVHTYFIDSEGILVHNLCAELENRSLQHEFSKHAKDFGIEGNWNTKNAEIFKKKIIDHVNNEYTIKINSSYRGVKTKLYYNPNTKIGVHLKSRNIFWTGWKLSPNQLEYNGLT